MLFNSVTFLCGFLPVVLLGFFVLAGTGRQRAAGLWLTAASLIFYGWWNPIYVPLLLGSMGANYLLGGYLMRHRSTAALVAGIVANVLLLGYFKYTGFLVSATSDAFGLGWTAPHIVLPLAISFFTFQQIAYLSDAHDGAVVEHDALNYCLFITFFPHLIAGPITHHREMLPQFSNPETFRPRMINLSVGTTLFLLGLFKKVALADPLGVKASAVFGAAAVHQQIQLLDAWSGALQYTLQIYFDFSGYSDMAIGLGLLFGISLPPNFDSPYKARNVIEFWSRWHMTLTRFLTAYIYNPIVLRITRARVAAGKPLPRRGKMSAGTFLNLVAFPTILTMFISGVWHGAGWQFIVFGLLHGVYLVTAHGWRAFKASKGWPLESANPAMNAASVLLTFLCVVVAMVFFRAADLPAALDILAGMIGLHGATIPLAFTKLPGLAKLAQPMGAVFSDPAFFRPVNIVDIAAMLAIVWALPNTQQWLGHFRTALNFRARESWIERLVPASSWRPTIAHGVVVGLIGFYALAVACSQAPTEFLYFRF